MCHTEHLLIVLFIAVRIPKNRTEGIAPLRLALGETGLESCGTDTALSLPNTRNVKIGIVFLDDTLCWFLLRKLTAFIGNGEIRRIRHDELFEESVTINRKTTYLLNTVLVRVTLTAPPLQSRLAPRIFLQQHFKRFVLPLKTMSLQTHHLFGNIFRQERNTILFHTGRDRLIGLDTLNGDTVFLFKEVKMLLSGGVFKSSIYPEILDFAVLIDLVYQVKNNITVTSSADTAHGRI